METLSSSILPGIYRMGLFSAGLKTKKMHKIKNKGQEFEFGSYMSSWAHQQQPRHGAFEADEARLQTGSLTFEGVYQVF